MAEGSAAAGSPGGLNTAVDGWLFTKWSTTATTALTALGQANRATINLTVTASTGAAVDDVVILEPEASGLEELGVVTLVPDGTHITVRPRNDSGWVFAHAGAGFTITCKVFAPASVIRDPTTAGNVLSISTRNAALVEGVAGGVPQPTSTTRSSSLLTSTLLAASGVYANSAQDTNADGTSYVTLTALPSNQNGAALVIEQTDDLTNWVLGSGVTVPAGTNPTVVSAAIVQRYWRAVYINGTTAQTGTFTLYATTFQVPPLGAITQSVTGTFWQATQPTKSANDATTTTSVPASSSNLVVKASAGRLVNAICTTVGTTDLLIYDNASTNSGTIIGIVPATAKVGDQFVWAAPAANGITAAKATTTPVATLYWN